MVESTASKIPANLYTFEQFKAESECYLKALWQGGTYIDGDKIIDCQLQHITNNPFLPKEYELQLKLTVKRAEDNMLFKMSIMYSVTNQLPELFFICEKEEVDGGMNVIL